MEQKPKQHMHANMQKILTLKKLFQGKSTTAIVSLVSAFILAFSVTFMAVQFLSGSNQVTAAQLCATSGYSFNPATGRCEIEETVNKVCPNGFTGPNGGNCVETNPPRECPANGYELIDGVCKPQLRVDDMFAVATACESRQFTPENGYTYLADIYDKRETGLSRDFGGPGANCDDEFDVLLVRNQFANNFRTDSGCQPFNRQNNWLHFGAARNGSSLNRINAAGNCRSDQDETNAIYINANYQEFLGLQTACRARSDIIPENGFRYISVRPNAFPNDISPNFGNAYRGSCGGSDGGDEFEIVVIRENIVNEVRSSWVQPVATDPEVRAATCPSGTPAYTSDGNNQNTCSRILSEASTGYEIDLESLEMGNCPTQEVVIGDVYTCEFPLSGGLNNAYVLPSSPITAATSEGSGANQTPISSGYSAPCTIANNSTPNAALVCTGIPTEGGSEGIRSVLLRFGLNDGNTFGTVELIEPPVDIDYTSVDITCTSAEINTTTECTFDLPEGTDFVPGTKLSIGDGDMDNTSCTLNSETNVITCLSVDTGTQTGDQPIFIQEPGESRINTVNTVQIFGSNTSGGTTNNGNNSSNSGTNNGSTNQGSSNAQNQNPTGGQVLGARETLTRTGGQTMTRIGVGVLFLSFSGLVAFGVLRLRKLQLSEHQEAREY